jgi:hypothetical protein
MDFDEVRPRPKGRGIAQEYWTGVTQIDDELDPKALDAILEHLPHRKCARRELHVLLNRIYVRIRESVLSEELGPTRADQTAMLRQIIKKLVELKKALFALTEREIEEFCVGLSASYLVGSKITWADFFELVLEAATDLRGQPPAIHAGFTHLSFVAEYFIDYPARIDGKTQSAILLSSLGRNIDGPALSCRFNSLLVL